MPNKDDEVAKLKQEVANLEALVKALSSGLDKVSSSQSDLSEIVKSLVGLDKILQAEKSLSEVRQIVESKLPGDSTTEAPPPDISKKKKKKKGG